MGLCLSKAVPAGEAPQVHLPRPASLLSGRPAHDGAALACCLTRFAASVLQAPATAPVKLAPEAAQDAPPQVALQASAAGPISLVNTNDFPGEMARDQQLRACRMIDTPPEPRFDAITKYAGAALHCV